ncbi:MAG: hypothetical protein FJX29_11770 [Alphaproteobacteria bacterium]|nr:hypothetical protein [Alphaproteobacteria bacterium]
MPGAPAIVVKNLPGAGSAKAAAMIASVSPKDGTSVGIVFPGVIIGPVLEPAMGKLFDPAKFIYIGSADSGTRVCVTYQTSKIKTIADAQRMKTIVGASAAGGSTRDYAHMLNHTSGTQFQVVSGYKGTADIFLAVERGEVDGLCGLDWSSLKAQRANWLAENKLNIIVQTALDREPALNDLRVPHIHEFIKTDIDRKAADLVMSQQVFGRPFILPPGTNPEAVKLLREAFLKALADKELLAEAQKMRIDINPIDGERVQKLVESLYSMPADVVERAKRISLQ